MLKNREEIKKELLAADDGSTKKDILIVVHSQYEYISKCINSIFKNTKNFNIHIWNNASDKRTTEYLSKISKQKNIRLYSSKQNLGFIVPNNEMIKNAKCPYIILLNSDVEVLPDWDNVLIGWLKKNPNVFQTGYTGGYLSKQGRGIRFGKGANVDYICGFCFCIAKSTYQKFGLFDDKNLKFAYCEDSDFSLRLRSKNKKIYACYSNLVIHHENKTVRNVSRKINMAKFIHNNQNYIKSKWSKYFSGR